MSYYAYEFLVALVILAKAILSWFLAPARSIFSRITINMPNVVSMAAVGVAGLSGYQYAVRLAHEAAQRDLRRMICGY